MKFRFSTLANVNKTELIEVFNSTFADYFVKIELSEQTLADKICAENIDLSKSVGAFLAEKLVGFILIGIEGTNSYNGGTGVLPKFRGNHLTEKMYDFILPKLKAEGVYLHQLEVITANFPAIKTYEKIGFTRARTLACFKGKIRITKINKDVGLRFLDDIDRQLFPVFLYSQPSWQNSLSAVNRTINQHKIVGAFYQSELVGYLIYTENGRIKQVAVDQDFRHLGIGQTLCSQLNNKEIIITNVDKNDEETVSFFKKIGLNLFLEQFEMQLAV